MRTISTRLEPSPRRLATPSLLPYGGRVMVGPASPEVAASGGARKSGRAWAPAGLLASLALALTFGLAATSARADDNDPAEAMRQAAIEKADVEPQTHARVEPARSRRSRTTVAHAEAHHAALEAAVEIGARADARPLPGGAGTRGAQQRAANAEESEHTAAAAAHSHAVKLDHGHHSPGPRDGR